MNERIQKLLASVKSLIADGLLSAAKVDDLKEKYPELLEDIELLAEADPTPQKKYLNWGVQQLRHGAYAPELIEAIKQYHAALPRMRGPDKDIQTLANVEDMKFAVSRAGQVHTRAITRQRAKEGAVLLYEDDRWLLVHPETMDAAIYYGSNTSWCISRRDKTENMFYSYAASKNVQFYFLIDNQAEAYTETSEAAKSNTTHFSKLAMLFSDGQPYSLEPFQDAANRKPSREVVEEALGAAFLRKMLAIAREHAEKHTKTWSFEILDTRDKATFTKLADQHAADLPRLPHQAELVQKMVDFGYPISPKLLEQLPADVRRSMAWNPSTLVESLKQLATDDDYGVRLGVAQNPSTPAEILKRLATDRGADVRLGVAQNPSTPAEILKQLATDAETLKQLATDSKADVRKAAQDRLRAMNIVDAVSVERVVPRQVVHAQEFEQWMRSLKDKPAVNAILSRIERIKQGNFGDYQRLRDGVAELRVDVGPGYRIYYGETVHLGQPTVILLNAGSKKSQDKDIMRASELLPGAIAALPRPRAQEQQLEGRQYRDYAQEYMQQQQEQQRTPKSTTPMFEGVPNETFLDLGIPPASLQKLRNLMAGDDDGLMALAERLPTEIATNLLNLAINKESTQVSASIAVRCMLIVNQARSLLI